MSFEVKYKIVESFITGGADHGVAVGTNESKVVQFSGVFRTLDPNQYIEILSSPYLENFSIRKVKDKKSELSVHPPDDTKE